MNFIFHFIYGIIRQPLTNSYFSRWLLHHQPALTIETIQCGPPFTIAKLVNIPPITMFHDAQITIEFMGVINHNITRGAHIVIIYIINHS